MDIPNKERCIWRPRVARHLSLFHYVSPMAGNDEKKHGLVPMHSGRFGFGFRWSLGYKAIFFAGRAGFNIVFFKNQKLTFPIGNSFVELIV